MPLELATDVVVLLTSVATIASIITILGVLVILKVCDWLVAGAKYLIKSIKLRIREWRETAELEAAMDSALIGWDRQP